MKLLLTKSEIERPRQAHELYEWVCRVNNEFGETRTGKTAMRLESKDYLKQFREEVWPLANYAEQFFRERSDVRFKPVVGNQPYDALLLDESGSTVGHFEITQAVADGKQRHFRNMHLDKYGHAPLTGPCLEKDQVSGEIVENWGDCVPCAETVDAVLSEIRNAIEAKTDKEYPPGTVLIVEFEDYLLQSPENENALDVMAKSELCRLPSRLTELALVGNTARIMSRAFRS